MLEDVIEVESGEESTAPGYIKPGAVLRLFIRADNRYNGLLHIRAIVDEDQVVYWKWSRRRGRVYKIDWIEAFRGWHELGWLTFVRMEKEGAV